MEQTTGKTPTMAFVLSYLREFPGAEYLRVKKAAQAAGIGIPAPVVYGNALRVIRIEGGGSRNANPTTEAAAPRVRRGRRRGSKRGVQDLAGLVAEMHDVVDERDRLREAVDQILTVIRQLRR
jgi:hypothetical protein